MSAADKAVRPIIAVYDLDGVVTESGQSRGSMLDNPLDAAPPLTMLDVSRSLGKAAADPAVKAVVMAADEAELDLSQAQEIRNQLMAMRAAGKDVWMYSEHLTNRTALIGSAYHFRVAHRTTGLDDAARAGVHHHIQAITKREEGVARRRRAGE